MTNILITGSSGQIGSELIDYLLASYDGQIIATDIKKVENFKADGRVKFETLDIRDWTKLYGLIDQYQISEIYHLASILSASGEKDPFLAYNVNLTGTVNVLNASVAKKIDKLFIPSSIAVYGPEADKNNAGTRHSSIPTTMYGITKLSAEMLCQYYNRKYDLDVRSIRFPGVISSKVSPTAGTTDFSVEMIKSAVGGKNYTCYLKKETSLPMVYMEDAMRSTLRLMATPRDSIKIRTSYNIMGYSMTCEELEDEIRKTYPEFKVNYVPDYRQKIADTWPQSVDVSDAKRDWNFSANFNLEKTVNEMIHNLKLDMN